MALIENNLLPGQYYTIEKSIDREMSIQRSRFIGSLRKVKNRDEVDFELKQIATLYPKASHYCWAYRFAGEPILEHSSDAGEPSGTAGRPILGALKKHALENILAVVTRYYGGVKLGVKGLIAAYGDTTLLAVENSKIVIEEPSSLFSFACTYDLYNILLTKLERASIDHALLQTDFTEEISGRAVVPNSLLVILKKELDSINTSKTNFTYTIRPLSDR